MLTILYSAKFVRMYKGLEPALQEEVREKITLFRNPKSHASLKVHKLQGRLEGRYAFSVNYRIRVIFRYENKKIASLLTVGPHDQTYR
jgi:mRNA-degrading endonuclease YafQ of YafQ-DinJ toxin-antitoxin module